MLVPLFVATLGAAALRSQGKQLKLGLHQGFRLRPLGGVVTAIGTDGVLYDLDEQGAAVPSSRVLRSWRHHLLLMPPELDKPTLDTDALEELVLEQRVLVLNLAEREAASKFALVQR